MNTLNKAIKAQIEILYLAGGIEAMADMLVNDYSDNLALEKGLFGIVAMAREIESKLLLVEGYLDQQQEAQS